MKRALFAIALAGCGDSTTAIDLELLPSPELNSVGDLVSRVNTLVIVVDAAVGRLYPPDAEQLVGDVQIKNADADPGDLELVAIVPMPANRLPKIRIERGGLPDVPLHVRVLGSAGGEGGMEMARGGVTNVSFVDGDITSVATPFNMLPQLLPIRVTEVVPGDGEVVPCDSKFDILAVFSRALDPASVTPGRMSVTELGAGDVAPESLNVSLNSITFVPTTSVLDYRLAVSTDVTDIAGGPLDQIAAMVGLQPYAADFHLACDGQQSPETPWCSPTDPTARCPGPPGRYVCDAGTCVPASCESAACVGGFVCDPSTRACEIDCRLYGAETCPGDRPVCDPAGYCVP